MSTSNKLTQWLKLRRVCIAAMLLAVVATNASSGVASAGSKETMDRLKNRTHSSKADMPKKSAIDGKKDSTAKNRSLWRVWVEKKSGGKTSMQNSVGSKARGHVKYVTSQIAAEKLQKTWQSKYPSPDYKVQVKKIR